MFILLNVFFPVQTWAGGSDLKSWSDFDHFMQDSKNRHENEGLSYMISGSLAVIGGTVGYQSETDSLGKLMLSVTQSLGVAAVAYGAEQYYLGSEYQSFYMAVKESHLTDSERSEVLTRFLDNEKK